MAVLSDILQAIDTVYPGSRRWVTSSSKNEHIIDDATHGCVFTAATTVPGFDVINPSGVCVALVQIDGKLLPPKKGGQCDCAFVYDESFNLVEFKTNATSFNKKTVRKTYNKAIGQLKNTLVRFKAAGLNILSLATDAEAHVCFSNVYPRKKASEMNRSMRFAAETCGVGLFFENSKSI